ncbi:glycosyltransferase [Flavobacterium sp. xlx-214]|uniref:glycosyltransferase n=1 Tax=unclassified Flavobacterium TaxID=196869 RepID=UPI0013D639AC|nr:MULTISPECIES: glycosyltransferase [unclassified Flavobacterium]MBA5794035.1 glycosyltransferase [Flavobacterium sp. xlx-221]QMI83150.1 glycosyltransferase [Flavobacterium sp. xlx-214]
MEKEKKRILIISGEAWRNESNGGNVLTNLFEPLKDDYEFAQIYTNSSLPNNKICTKYFHLSESKMLKSILNRKSFGKILIEKNYKSLYDSEFNNRSRVDSMPILFLKKFFNHTLYFLQNILWAISVWKSEELKKFIKDHNPDIIFAPLYSGIFIHRIDRFVVSIMNKKMISYVSDDVYTFKQFSISPMFWINRLILRANVRKTAKHYSLLYTMTQEQLDEYQPVLNVPMKVLKKAGAFNEMPKYKKDVRQKPIILFYGGNLIYNRYKTLSKLAKTIRKLNTECFNFQLLIGTQTPITKKLNKLLNDGKNSIILGRLNSDQMQDYYQLSDIVLHVESFDVKQKLLTRLSFSTKIIDLLNTGRCVMAICWSKSSPYKYLKKEDAAICIDNILNIEQELNQILKNPNVMQEYANKAWDCGVRNHKKDIVIEELRKDFQELSK